MQELAGETITRGNQEWRSPGLEKELRTNEFLHFGYIYARDTSCISLNTGSMLFQSVSIQQYFLLYNK